MTGGGGGGSGENQICMRGGPGRLVRYGTVPCHILFWSADIDKEGNNTAWILNQQRA